MAALTEGTNTLHHGISFCRNKILNKDKWRNYIGSVRFFKHLILTTLLLLITVPWFFVVSMFIKYNAATTEIENMERLLDSSLMSGMNMQPEDNISLPAVIPPTEVPSYQLLYPDFYAPQELNLVDYSDKTIYLTFDDGPSPRTPEVLKILEENGVKATFL